MDEYRVFLIAAACLLAGAAVAYAAGRAGWRWGVLGTVGAAVAGMAWGTTLSRVGDGMASLAWFVFVLVFALPAFAGAVVGGWLGLKAHARRGGRRHG